MTECSRLLLSVEDTEKRIAAADVWNLAAIPKRVRSAFHAPINHTLLDFDIRTCHPAILAAMAGDQALSKAIQSDLHALAGAWLDPGLARPEQRARGKLLNSLMVADAAPPTIARNLEISTQRALAIQTAWWASFPRARSLRDRVSAEIAGLVSSNRSLKLIGGGRTLARYDRWFLRGQPRRGSPARDSDKRHAFRSVWTGLLRAAESLLLDQMLIAAHEQGARLVIPMFDGAVLALPARAESATAHAVVHALNTVLHRSGVPTRVTFQVREAWGDQGSPGPEPAPVAAFAPSKTGAADDSYSCSSGLDPARSPARMQRL